MGFEIATNSAAILPNIVTGMSGLGSAIMYSIPIAIIGYSFYQAMDFNKSNKVFFASIEDILDKDIFQKMVVPLYGAITNNLFAETFTAIRGESAKNKKKFLENYEVVKKEKLKGIDFTFLNEALDFQGAIIKIIESRKSHSDFSKLKKDTKWCLIISGAASVLSVIFLIAANITSFFFSLALASNLLVAIYSISLLISLCVLGKYVKSKLALDNFA